MKLYEAFGGSLQRRKKGANDSPIRASELQHKWQCAYVDTAITDNHETDPREKGRDLIQSYEKLTTQKRHQKLWLHNNFGQT